jgi:hypothetical protein
MTYRARIAILLLILFAEIAFVGAAHAAGPVLTDANNGGTINLSVQMVGESAAQPLCAITRSGDAFAGVAIGQCAATPPPVNDPNALNIIIGKYTSHACSNFSTSTGQDFGSTFGEGVTAWPYHPSTGVSMTLPAHGRYYGGIISTGQNPGILPHYLKGDPYAGSCNPRLYSTVGARVHVRVVAVGNTPAPTGRCDIPVAAFDASPWVQLKFAGPPNSSHCLGQIGGAYRYIVENNGATNITALMTYN